MKNIKKVIIVCEDIYGLDVYSMIEAINSYNHKTDSDEYDVLGFISDCSHPFGTLNTPAPLLGMISNWNLDPAVSFIMGIRDPKQKEIAAVSLKKKGAFFETLIAPWVLLPFEFKTGEGCIIGNYSCKYRSIFGNFVTLDTVMCETVEIGDYSTLSPFVNITNSKIGKGVYVGSHAVIMEHKTVGNGSYIYPGSVVVNNLKEDSKVAGIPATRTGVKKWLR